ncbi:MAG: phosphate acyltransferase PlsX [bacterium]|nr:phosphate acyltransferase PlsX [bacterium]
MKLAIDVMGGDHAPDAILEGCLQALSMLQPETELLLFGDSAAINGSLRTVGDAGGRLHVYPTTEVIGCDEAPTRAIRAKKDSSLVRAVQAVADGEADCVVSAGNTGALLTAATLIIRRIDGVKRPALAPLLPTVAGNGVLLIDSGANTDCKPAYLQQFALMGAAYMHSVQGIENPRVGLLNNGAEAEKGSELTKAAHALLLETPVNFAGNCEARDALSGDVDVLVCDGFDGNVLLKGIEGTVASMLTLLKQNLYATLRTKAGAALAKPAFRALKHKLDYTEHGGAPLLGVKGGVIKAHGSSNATAFCNAVLQAERLVAADVTGRISQALSALVKED